MARVGYQEEWTDGFERPGPAWGRALVRWSTAVLLASLFGAAGWAMADSTHEAPPGHGYHAMAYDASAVKILLFGGQTGDVFGHSDLFLSAETWSYDPTREDWRRLQTAGRPPALTAHAMVYHAAAKKVLLYGGVRWTGQKTPELVRETWSFDYQSRSWTRMADGPPARYGHRMVYDPRSGVVVLFGGACIDAAGNVNAKKLGDTWVYHLETDHWEHMNPSPSPSPRHYHGMAYDARTEKTIVFGGAQEGTSRQGEYLGQRRPGAVPVLFAPGVVSSDLYEHGAPAFAPDGGALYWSVYWEKEDRQTIFRTRREGGRWLAPEKAPFVEERYLDGNPVFSRDGERLYFTSNRPLAAGGDPRGHSLWIWFVERTAHGWSPPQPLAATFAEVSLASAPAFGPDGTLLVVPWKGEGLVPFDIYSAAPLAGRFEGLRRLSGSINTDALEEYPFVAADGRYLLFSSARPGGLGREDLYVSFRGEDGSWLPARSLGPDINSPSSERFPYVTPDGKFLFFGSDRNGSLDYYWVEAGVVDALRRDDPHGAPAGPGGQGTSGGERR